MFCFTTLTQTLTLPLPLSGLHSNTAVLFHADHGWKLGEHGDWSKCKLFTCPARCAVCFIASFAVARSNPWHGLRMVWRTHGMARHSVANALAVACLKHGLAKHGMATASPLHHQQKACWYTLYHSESIEPVQHKSIRVRLKLGAGCTRAAHHPRTLDHSLAGTEDLAVRRAHRHVPYAGGALWSSAAPCL